jgi:hypothetical protein
VPVPAPRHTPHASLKVVHRGGGMVQGQVLGARGGWLETGPLPASERFDRDPLSL